MEALPAFQPGGLPKTFPHLGRVSLYSTIAVPREAVIYRFYELETCHLLRIVAEGTPIQTADVRYPFWERCGDWSERRVATGKI